MKVNPVIYDCKKKTEYRETAFYLSNQGVKHTLDFELAQAIRQHWKVETNNYIRDVTAAADRFQGGSVKNHQSRGNQNTRHL